MSGFPNSPGQPQQAIPTDILTGIINLTATTAATNLLVIPAGRTWQGTVTIQCAVSVTGAVATTGQATGLISCPSANEIPSGLVVRCDALAGANVAAGTVGTEGHATVTMPLTVFNGNPVNSSIQYAATITGASAASVNIIAIGALL